MKANKEIRVYGTLKNHTLDPSKSNGHVGDSVFHNDALAYAYQLFDDRFGEPTAVNNYQDVINKRLTAISYATPGITTIENRDGSQGNPYMLIVKGNTNIGGKLYVDGDIYYKGSDGNYHPLSLDDILARLAALEARPILWEIDPSDANRVVAKDSRAAVAKGFYDSDPAMH